jgi:cytochrome c biogenesis protein CcmG/thiol:disulfide interchange protein DsbE
LLLSSSVTALANPEATESPIAAGVAAPEFTLPALSTGEPPVSLAAYRGRPVLLEFWSYWCGPCRASLPEIAALGREFGSDRLAVIAISVDPDADGETLLQTYAGDVVAANDRDGAMADRFDVAHLPAAFVIGADGVILNVLSGFDATERALRSGIEEALRAN